MKKIFNMMMCLAVAAFATSCSDDNDNPYAHKSLITITESKLAFDAVASDAGRVAFKADGNVTVKTSADWCTAVLQGDTVKVSVTQNDTRYARAASIVLRCKDDSAVVSLVQKGVMLQIASINLVANTDEATSVSCDCEANVDMVVESKPDWTNVTIADGKLKVDFAANNSGTFRRGVVVMRSDNFVDSVNVGQYDFEQDIKGTYKLTYYRDTTYTSTRQLNATVNDNTIRISGMNLNLPYTFDESTMSIVVSSGDYVGTQSSNYLYVMTADENMQYWSGFNSGVTISATLNHDADGNVVAPFRTEYSGVVYSTIIFGRFTSRNFTQENYAGVYQYLYRPTMTRALAK